MKAELEPVVGRGVKMGDYVVAVLELSEEGGCICLMRSVR